MGASPGLGSRQEGEPRRGERSFHDADSYAPTGARGLRRVGSPGLAPWANVLRPSGPENPRLRYADFGHEVLVRPYAEKPKRLKESAALEVHVAWLLGLFGCPTIVLGKYERLIAPQTKVELGSVTSSRSLRMVKCYCS